MRKLYAILAGLFIALASINVSAQTNTTCTANFTWHDSIITGPPPTHLVRFNATAVSSQNSPVVSVCWNFGDGSPQLCIQASSTNPPANLLQAQHTYTGPGPYNVCVRIVYAGGCVAEKCKLVQLINIPPPPVDTCRANFERLPSIGTTPLNAYFKAQPWHNNGKKPSRICWQFGDGRDTCINYSNSYTGLYTVGHTYNQPGNYQVCVKITYVGGCEATKCELVRVGVTDSCRADFERIPVTVNNQLAAGFKALPWHSNNKKPVRICWQFGDGRDTCIQYPANYTGQYTVTHTYANPGTYTVCVKILYEGGCEAIKCNSITIPPVPVTCTVNLIEITPSITSTTRAFLAVPNSTPSRRPQLVCWNFGDGTPDTCITIPPNTPVPNLYIQHTYPGPGVYRPCVTVKFDGGCTATSCKEVVIRPSANICGGYMTDSLIAPRTIKFKGFSIHAPNDQVLSYRWTFGDGTSAIGQQVTHTYNVAGTYNVCLIIRTALGCETHICRPVRVPGTNTPQLVITPNPVLTQFNALFNSTHAEAVTIRITNNFGNTVQTHTRTAVVGMNNWGFNVSSLMPGIYSFIVQSPNQLASAVFIKL